MQLKDEDLAIAQEIKEFLETNYQDHYDYEDLVHKFGMNKFKLKFAFKAVSNYNVHEFITKTRVNRAMELLESTDRTIKYIAAKVGLDKSNLIIHFKKITGHTPAKWRKTVRANAKGRYEETEN